MWTPRIPYVFWSLLGLLCAFDRFFLILRLIAKSSDFPPPFFVPSFHSPKNLNKRSCPVEALLLKLPVSFISPGEFLVFRLRVLSVLLPPSYLFCTHGPRLFGTSQPSSKADGASATYWTLFFTVKSSGYFCDGSLARKKSKKEAITDCTRPKSRASPIELNRYRKVSCCWCFCFEFFAGLP